MGLSRRLPKTRSPLTSTPSHPLLSSSPSPSPSAGIIAHGTAQLLQERPYINSDAYRVHVCNTCGLIAVADLVKGVFACRACKTSGVSQVYLPYAMKLLIQELMAMQIAPRMLTMGGTGRR
jgi:DNA-directed RNA polymerase II subunit RPB2